MPYHWDTETKEAPEISGASFYETGGPPLARLKLSAHNSLSPKGFVIFIGATFALVLVPLLAVVGSPVLWVLLPFVASAIALVWWALQRSWTDKAVTETLEIWSDRVELIHSPGRGPQKTWSANSYWVRLQIYAQRGGHEQYLTLSGSQDSREVELGSFLTAEERRALFAELSQILAVVTRTGGDGL